jgi:hypothetical protein
MRTVHANGPGGRRRAPPLLKFCAALAWVSLAALAAQAQAVATPAAAVSATLEDQINEYAQKGKPHLRWQTFWVLNWQPVTGATHYEIRYKTAEGTSRKVKTVDKPPFRLEVAKGDNAKAQGLLARQVQLDTVGSLLSAQVVARLPDGQATELSPWLQVGLSLPVVKP